MTHDDMLFRAAVRMSTYGQEMDKEWAREMCQRRLHEELSHKIALKKVEHIMTSDYYEQRLELYVATPDEFWAVVNAEAMRIASRLNSRIEVKDG